MKADFEEMVHTHARRLRFIAVRYGGRESAQDVYQEIVLQLWRSFASFRGEAERATWLYRVALNTALMWQRRETKWPMQSSAETIEPSQPEGQCQATVLEDFLAALNEIDSAVLMMHLDDVSAADIAQVLGISSNAVHIRINRMKQKFNDRYVD